MEELRRQVETLLKEVAELRAEVLTLRAENVKLLTKNTELKTQVAELQLELVQRKKGFRPKANTSTRAKSTQDQRRQHLEDRLDALIFSKPKHPDCQRICKRLVKHRFELLLFLEKPNVPVDNNLAERDIRSVAAARADGGVNRSDRGAKVYANIKTIIRTC